LLVIPAFPLLACPEWSDFVRLAKTRPAIQNEPLTEEKQESFIRFQES
jgi:hypothetical protein